MMKRNQEKESQPKMMKQKIAFFSFCLLLLCGCADGSDTDTGSGVSVPLRLQSVGVAGDGDVASRAVSTISLATDKKIGFFVRKDEFNQLKSNVEGGYVESAWQPLSTSAGVWLNNHDAAIAIYAPYDETQQNASSLTLKACLRGTDDANNDIMCSEVFTANNGSTIPPVTLKQVYTRLVFSFVKDDTYPEPHPLKIKAVELKGNDMYSSTTYELLATPPVYVKPVNSTVIRLDIPEPYPVVGKESEPPGLIDLLLIPVTQEFTGDATLTITLTTDKKISVVIPQATFNANRPFAPGKQYVLKVRILPTEMEIESVERENWKEGFIVDKGDEFQFDN